MADINPPQPPGAGNHDHGLGKKPPNPNPAPFPATPKGKSPNLPGVLTPGGGKGPSGASSHRTWKPGGSGMDAFRKWLGPAGYKAFLSNLSQMISVQVKQGNAEAAKAARKLKASQEGKDPSDVD